jgi:hypothetical protein
MNTLGLVFSILGLLGLGILTLIFAVQEGWFDRWETSRRLIHAIKTTVSILEGISAMTNNKTKTHCSINNTGLSASISYTRGGNEKLLNIPYRKDLRANMSSWNVYLIHDDNTNTNITQENGFPYFCNAKQLGGKEIAAHNFLTDVRQIYKADQVPMFLGEDL